MIQIDHLFSAKATFTLLAIMPVIIPHIAIIEIEVPFRHQRQRASTYLTNARTSQRAMNLQLFESDTNFHAHMP